MAARRGAGGQFLAGPGIRGKGVRKGMFRVKVTGLDEMVVEMNRAFDDIEKAVGAALYEIGNNVMAEAKQEAPLDLGTLAGSGYVTMPEINGTEINVELGFGGPARDYAEVQHERPPYQNPNTPGRKPKYLEDPLQKQLATFMTELGSRAGRALERKQGAKKTDTPVTPDEGSN